VKNLHVLEYSIMTPFKIKTCHFGQNIAKTHRVFWIELDH
jgi:hypothetical protein